MEHFIEANPKTVMYILYLSAAIVVMSMIALFYYTRSQEYLKVINRSEKIVSPPPTFLDKNVTNNKPKKKDEELENEDGFIIVNAD